MTLFLSIQNTYQTIEFALFDAMTLIDIRKDDKRQASKNFIPLLDDLLTTNTVPMQDLSFIAVNQGPGPFTTLRVIIASVNGLSFASGIPLIGIDGLDAFVHEYHDPHYPNTVILLNAFAQTLKQFTSSVVVAVLRALFDDAKSPLSHEEEIQVFLGTAWYHATNKDTQSAIFDLLPGYQQLVADNPVFFIAARGTYAPVIPDLVAWLKGRPNKAASKQLLQSWTAQALDQAVRANEVTAIESLYAQSIRLNKPKASALLWQVVDEDKDVAFVPFLVRRGKADVSYVGKGRRTLLVRAVENNNKDMVQALLEDGADSKKITDPALGTAAQIAFDRGYVEIEELLRSYENK